MADGMPLLIGETGVHANTSTHTTTLTRSGGATTVAFDVDNADGIAITANTRDSVAIAAGSESDLGVSGTSYRAPGVEGDSEEDAGVFGSSGLGDGVAGNSERGDGVSGQSSQGNGVSGRSVQIEGVFGESLQSVGVAGTTKSDDSAGVFGDVVTDSAGVWGQVVGGAGSWPGVGGWSSTGQGVRGVSIGLLPSNPIGVAGVAGWSQNGAGVVGQTASSSSFGGVFHGGLVVANGPKSAAVPHPDGSQRLLYSMESPDSWFEDFGRADLVHGQAKVALEAMFAAVVHTDDYHVFLSPEGETNGLYVSSRNTAGFEIREQQRGTSNTSFSYRIVARRKDIEAPRFRKIDLPSFDAKDMRRMPKGIDLSRPIKPQRPRRPPRRRLSAHPPRS